MTPPRVDARPLLSLVVPDGAPRERASAPPASPVRPLLPDIAAGDERAVAVCVARYGALVWSLVRRSGVAPDEAEDTVQDVFIDLWRTAARFDAGRASEAGWVAMIARRRIIDRVRRQQRLPALEPMTPDIDVADDRVRDVDRESRADQARAVLRELPAMQRRMLELSLVEGKTHDEIARETGTPLGTVKSHIRRGLQRARDAIAGNARTSHGHTGVAR